MQDPYIKEKSLKSQMLYDALMIFKSTEYIEKEINIRLSKLDDEDLSIDNLLGLQNEIMTLLRKLNLEEGNMDKYMEKYRKLIQEQKIKIQNGKEEKSIHNTK